MCADRLIKVLETSENKELNVQVFFKRFTMDSIWNCAFGIDIDLQNNPDNEYFTRCEDVFGNNLKFPFYFKLGSNDCFPMLINVSINETIIFIIS